MAELRVKDEVGLVRDSKSKAILSKDKRSYLARLSKKKEQERIKYLESTVEKLLTRIEALESAVLMKE